MGEHIQTKISCNVLYSTFSGTLFYCYNHYYLRVPISLCSIQITSDREQKTWWT